MWHHYRTENQISSIDFIPRSKTLTNSKNNTKLYTDNTGREISYKNIGIIIIFNSFLFWLFNA